MDSTAFFCFFWVTILQNTTKFAKTQFRLPVFRPEAQDEKAERVELGQQNKYMASCIEDDDFVI